MSIIKKLKDPEFATLFIFHLIFVIILIVNFPTGKFFIGWDALNPEFNLALNFKRVFSAFWQENQGLGLLGGHGFAAVLPHNLITLFLSIFLPLEAIRPAFTFLSLYFGGLGMYLLSKLLLVRVIEEVENIPKSMAYFGALLASLFYMLNLGTLQMFYIQLEAFVFHFMALPWLLLITIKTLQAPNRKNLLFFFLINFFATGQGFIPPLFVAYMFALTIFLLLIIFCKRFSISIV
ncbi:hypothetical protein MUP32_05685, partial [Candidatus Microgenomates bacterium]|nr:hypothetical protein [Candidatus Microgenomates bacterium]